MHSNNRRNRKKHANQVDKSELQNNYEEDYNEVILNDLVPEDKKEELGLQASNTNKTRKKGISLGLKKKKTTSNKNNHTEKSSKKQNKNINNLEETQGKNIKSKKKTKKQSKQTQEDNTKKNHYKHKYSEVSEVKEDLKENIENNIEDNNIKKTKKNKGHKRRNKNNKKEENINVKECNKEIEENDDINIEDENCNLRGIESNSQDTLEQIPQVQEVEPRTTKLENIVWSKENFPNK